MLPLVLLCGSVFLQVRAHCLTSKRTLGQTNDLLQGAELPLFRDGIGNVGSLYLLTCVDRFTRWPETLPAQPAETVAEASLGLTPSSVTTERGQQFESNLFIAFSQLLRTK
jgi:hypothetical protein